MSIGYTTIKFLAKEKIKIWRILWRAYNIKDLSCLIDIDLEPIFFDSGEEEKGKEVEQEEPSRQSPPRQPSLKQSFLGQAS